MGVTPGRAAPITGNALDITGTGEAPRFRPSCERASRAVFTHPGRTMRRFRRELNRPPKLGAARAPPRPQSSAMSVSSRSRTPGGVDKWLTQREWIDSRLPWRQARMADLTEAECRFSDLATSQVGSWHDQGGRGLLPGAGDRARFRHPRPPFGHRCRTPRDP